jgi:hypothetical protein
MGLYAGGLHIDTSLTNVSVMYRNQEFVSEKVFPIVPVEKQSNKYFVYGPDNLRSQADARRPGGLANEIDWSLSTAPYFADGHALAQYIPDEDRENADAAIDLDIDTTIQLTDKIFLNREINLVNSLLGSLTAVDLSANSYAQAFDSTTNSFDPVQYLDYQKETVAALIGKTPNVMLFSRPAWRGFRNNPAVLKHIFGTSLLAPGQQITKEQAQQLLEVDEVLVAEAINVTSAEGITPITTQYVWGQPGVTNGALALLFYRPSAPGLRTISLGYQFTWNTGRLGSLVYKDRAAKRHADWIEVQRYYALQVVSAGAGLLFKNAISTAEEP